MVLFVTKKRINVKENNKLNECRIAVSSSEKKKLESVNFFKNKNITKMGSIAYKIALVAKGEFDMALSFTKKMIGTSPLLIC